MTALVEKLDRKLQQWQPTTAHEVEQCVEKIIESADAEALDLLRSRQREQEVFHLLDAPQTR